MRRLEREVDRAGSDLEGKLRAQAFWECLGAQPVEPDLQCARAAAPGDLNRALCAPWPHGRDRGMGALPQTIEVNASAQRTEDEGRDNGRLPGRRALETHLQPGESNHRRRRRIASRPGTGRSQLVWAEGSHEVRETLPLPTRLDVHALQGDRPSLQVTADEAPQTRLNGDSVDHEKWRPITGWAEHDRSHHESERRIDAYRSLKVRAWEPGGELGDGTFAESASGGCRAEQRQDAKVKEGSQDQRRAERDPPPLGAGSGARRLQRPTRFRLKSRRLDGRGVRHEILRLRDQERGQTGAREGSLSIMAPK